MIRRPRTLQRKRGRVVGSDHRKLPQSSSMLARRVRRDKIAGLFSPHFAFSSSSISSAIFCVVPDFCLRLPHARFRLHGSLLCYCNGRESWHVSLSMPSSQCRWRHARRRFLSLMCTLTFLCFFVCVLRLRLCLHSSSSGQIARKSPRPSTPSEQKKRKAPSPKTAGQSSTATSGASLGEFS